MPEDYISYIDKLRIADPEKKSVMLDYKINSELPQKGKNLT